MSDRSLPGRSFPPQSDKYVPMPASSSSRLVTVIVHVACWTRWNSFALYEAVSGADVDDPAPRLWPLICSSQNRLNLFRCPACTVSLPSGCSGVCDWLTAGLVGSGTYVHFVGSPAFRL